MLLMVRSIAQQARILIPGTFAVFPVLADCTFLESQPFFWFYLITMVLSFSWK